MWCDDNQQNINNKSTNYDQKNERTRRRNLGNEKIKDRSSSNIIIIIIFAARGTYRYILNYYKYFSIIILIIIKQS